MPPSYIARYRIATIAAVAAILLAACGSGGQAVDSSGQPAATSTTSTAAVVAPVSTSPPTTSLSERTSADRVLAAIVGPTAADIPTGWVQQGHVSVGDGGTSPTGTPVSRFITTCEHVPLSALEQKSVESRATFFKGQGDSLTGGVNIYESDSNARTAFDADAGPTAPACTALEVKQYLASRHVNLSNQTGTFIPTTRVGDAAASIRVVATSPSASVATDYYYVRRGRAVLWLVVSPPLSDGAAAQILGKMVDRLAAGGITAAQ